MKKAQYNTRAAWSRFCLTVATTAICGVTAAQAQVPEAQITTASPGRVDSELHNKTVAPQVMPEIEVRELKLQGAPAGAEKVSFKFNALQLDGVTAYSESDLKSVYGGKLGQTITLADLYGIANDLTVKYRNDGYILTQVVVPPQTIESGTARLQVVEGYINAVAVQGDGGEANDLVKAYANTVNKTGPLNVRDLERALLLINDLPGVKARSILSPSTTQAGAADLRVIVTRDPWDGMLSIDNYGSRFLGPMQLTAAGSSNNLLGYNERLSAQATYSPNGGINFDPEMAYYSVSYDQPVWTQGTMLQVFFSHTNTEPGYTLEQFHVRGESAYASIKLEHPFIRSRALNLSGRALFDWRDVDSRNDLEDTRKDRIRAFRTGGHLEFLDTLMGAGVNALDIELAKGLGIFGASDGRDPNMSRAAGNPEFFKMNAELQRLQRLTGDLNLLVGVRGQWSSSALLSSEEFGLGGMGYGRGFDPSEVTGDDGVAGKLELQWNQPYRISFVEDYQLFSFFDAGNVWNRDATSSSTKKDALTSAGFGIRTTFPNMTYADLTVAVPLNRAPQTMNDTDPRVFFSLSKKF